MFSEHEKEHLTDRKCTSAEISYSRFYLKRRKKKAFNFILIKLKCEKKRKTNSEGGLVDDNSFI